MIRYIFHCFLFLLILSSIHCESFCTNCVRLNIIKSGTPGVYYLKAQNLTVRDLPISGVNLNDNRLYVLSNKGEWLYSGGRVCGLRSFLKPGETRIWEYNLSEFAEVESQNHKLSSNKIDVKWEFCAFWSTEITVKRSDYKSI